jgi:hypothetical protein
MQIWYKLCSFSSLSFDVSLLVRGKSNETQNYIVAEGMAIMHKVLYRMRVMVDRPQTHSMYEFSNKAQNVTLYYLVLLIPANLKLRSPVTQFPSTLT